MRILSYPIRSYPTYRILSYPTLSCYLKLYQAIHVKHYESCYWTLQREVEKEKAIAREIEMESWE